MIGAFALLLLSGAAAQPANLPKAATPEVAARRVKACGYEHVRVKDDRLLDEDVVVVDDVSDVPEAKMRCVAQVSLDTVTYVQFPEAVNEAYQRLYFRMADAQGQRKARAWLRKRGLLAKLPTYEKGKSDNLDFGRKIENVCGPKARGALALFKSHVILNPGTPGKPTMDNTTFECLFNAMWASGMPIGFVGNEYNGKK